MQSKHTSLPVFTGKEDEPKFKTTPHPKINLKITAQTLSCM